MKVSKEELLHIANLADLKIKDDEIDNYDLEETIGANENSNVFRKDEVKIFENHEGLMANAPEKERDMFKIPKVIS